MFDPNVYVQFLKDLAPMLLVLAVLTLLVLASGVLSALRNREFAWANLADYLRSIVLPKIGGWLLLELLAFTLGIVPEGTIPSGAESFSATAMGALADVSYGLLFISLAGKFIVNVRELQVLPPETIP